MIQPKTNLKRRGKNHIGIARDVKEIEVAVDQSLGPNDPEADRGEAEHDRIMHRDAEAERDQVKQDRHRAGHDVQLDERDARRRRRRAAALITLSSPNCFVETANWLSIGRTRSESSFPVRTSSGMFGDVNEEKGLEKLRDDLMRPDEQDDLPFRPVADPVDLTENDAEENDLAAEPEHFHHHPEDEVRLETHLADERVAQHDGIDLDITPHRRFPVI